MSLSSAKFKCWIHSRIFPRKCFAVAVRHNLHRCRQQCCRLNTALGFSPAHNQALISRHWFFAYGYNWRSYMGIWKSYDFYSGSVNVHFFNFCQTEIPVKAFIVTRMYYNFVGLDHCPSNASMFTFVNATKIGKWTCLVEMSSDVEPNISRVDRYGGSLVDTAVDHTDTTLTTKYFAANTRSTNRPDKRTSCKWVLMGCYFSGFDNTIIAIGVAKTQSYNL